MNTEFIKKTTKEDALLFWIDCLSRIKNQLLSDFYSPIKETVQNDSLTDELKIERIKILIFEIEKKSENFNLNNFQIDSSSYKL